MNVPATTENIAAENRTRLRAITYVSERARHTLSIPRSKPNDRIELSPPPYHGGMLSVSTNWANMLACINGTKVTLTANKASVEVNVDYILRLAIDKGNRKGFNTRLSLLIPTLTFHRATTRIRTRLPRVQTVCIASNALVAS